VNLVNMNLKNITLLLFSVLSVNGKLIIIIIIYIYIYSKLNTYKIH